MPWTYHAYRSGLVLAQIWTISESAGGEFFALKTTSSADSNTEAVIAGHVMSAEILWPSIQVLFELLDTPLLFYGLHTAVPAIVFLGEWGHRPTDLTRQDVVSPGRPVQYRDIAKNALYNLLFSWVLHRQIIWSEFSPTWSCVSLTRSTTSSEWNIFWSGKIMVNNFEIFLIDDTFYF